MLEPAQTTAIFQKQPIQSFTSGQIIFEIDQPGDCMYGVIEGEVDLVVAGKTVETIKVGDVFGEGALVHTDHIRASTAIAKTDTKLAVMTKYYFLFAVQETPLFALEIIKSLSSRLRGIKKQLQG